MGNVSSFLRLWVRRTLAGFYRRLPVLGTSGESARIVPLDARLRPVQHNAASALFAQFGIDLLPRRLVKHLDEFDLRFALRAFADELGVEYGLLLDPDRRRHRPVAGHFRAAVCLLHEIEAESAFSELDASPLIAALSRDIAEAKRLLRRFRQAEALRRLVESAVVSFPLYRDFQAEVRTIVANWAHLESSTIDEIANLQADHLKLQEALENTCDDLAQMFGWLGEHDAALRDLRSVVENMAGDSGQIESDINSGFIAPDEGVAKLMDLLEKVRLVARKLGYGVKGPSGASRLLECLAELGLAEKASFQEVKQAYWSMAKLYHPDRNGDPSAAEKFRAAQASFDWLEAYFAAGRRKDDA
jgi:DnaJ-domain-containing protein 1